MIVSDIYLDAKRMLGQCSESEIFSRLTDAVETLANKGQWEPMLGYIDIVATNRVVTLPHQVEVPIQININSTPSFSRSRLYEFTTNGPGNDMAETTGFSWMDKGTSPVIVQPTAPGSVTVTSLNAADNGKTITITGVATAFPTTQENSEVSQTLVLNNAVPPSTAYSFDRITRVSKPVTAGNVRLSSGATVLSEYFAGETEPQYRQIRLSKDAASVRMLFRRSTVKISSQSDFIPLHSKMAILMMLKANEAYRNGNIEQMALGQAYEKQALSFLKEEQDSRNTANELAAQDDPPIVGLNINNRDSIIAADIYDDAVKIFGKEGRQRTLDRITEAVEALANKGQWDGMDGYIDIMADENVITLPRYVEAPISINVGGRPASMRNRWFEFHLNGPGSDCCGVPASWTWHDSGEVVTLKDVDYEQQFVAIPDLADDNGKFIRIFGYDENDKWIRTINPSTLLLDDGVWITINSAVVIPAVDAQKVARIERIVKDPTRGFVRLDGFDIDRNTTTIIGYYWPDETEPRYRRIKVGCSCGWVRMRYRKRTRKITSLFDPIHLQSKLSVVTMMMSLAALGKSDVQTAEALEQKAVQYLANEERTRAPGDVFSFEFDTGVSWANPMQGII